MQGFCLILAFFDTLIISRISLNSLHCKDFSIIQQTLNRLPGYPQPVPQGLLGEAQFLSLLCDALPHGHGIRSFLVAGTSIAENGPDFY